MTDYHFVSSWRLRWLDAPADLEVAIERPTGS